MPSVTWDDAFEISPADTDEAKYGASKIRQLKVAVRERGELELDWKAGTQPFGKAGKLAVFFSGTTAEINALTGMAAGAFAWDETLKVPKRYNGAAWVAIDIDHGTFSGLSDDDHPQYLKLDKAGQTLTQDLSVTASKTIDGRDVSADGTLLDSLNSIISAGIPKMLATPVNKISWSAATDWTDVDISVQTGSDTAKVAILVSEISFTSGYGSNKMTAWFRKNGSGVTSGLPRTAAAGQSAGEGDSAYDAGMILVEVDGSEVFEVKLQTNSGSPTSISFKVDLVGYFQ